MALVDKKSATESLADPVVLSATASCLRLSTTCARCRSVHRPGATSDCRRSDSSFLSRFRQGIFESERESSHEDSR